MSSSQFCFRAQANTKFRSGFGGGFVQPVSVTAYQYRTQEMIQFAGDKVNKHGPVKDHLPVSFVTDSKGTWLFTPCFPPIAQKTDDMVLSHSVM